MKSFIKVIISALALSALASLPVLRAQDATPPPAGGGGARGGRGGRGPTVDAIEKAVGGTLSADQKTKITAILAKLQTDTQALAQEDRRTKGPELRTAAFKEIRAVLTDADQQKKLDEYVASMGRGGRRGGGGGGGGGAGGPPPPAGGGGN